MATVDFLHIANVFCLHKSFGACFSAKTVVHGGWQSLSSPLCLSMLGPLRESWGGRLTLGCL